MSEIVHAGAFQAGSVVDSYNLGKQGDVVEYHNKRAEVRKAWQENNIDAAAAQIPEHMASASHEEKVEKIKKVAKEKPDFVNHWMDGCKGVSDEEIRKWWAKIMSGESDTPGSFSKKTLSILRDMDKKDTQIFSEFCQFVIHSMSMPEISGVPFESYKHTIPEMLYRSGDRSPLIYDVGNRIYTAHGRAYDVIRRLESIGLLIYYPISTFISQGSISNRRACYHNVVISMTIPKEQDVYPMDKGNVDFTDAGKELFKLCKPKENKNFLQYIIDEWKKRNYNPVIHE